MEWIEITQLPYFGFFAAFAAVVFVQLGFFWGIFSRLAFHRIRPVRHDQLPPVSVVICARNEYQNLKSNLPLIFAQDYPGFEVVVVNDASEDDSQYLLKDFGAAHPNLSIVTIEKDLNFFRGKKFPLSIGIKSAKHEILLLTDADCKPASDQWIRHMVAGYRANTAIVLGYGGYEPTRGFLSVFQRFETFQTALMYLSMALSHIPYMGVGRNLSYRKSLFYSSNGFISHYSIPSGDDDLFVNQAARKGNTTVSLHPDGFTYTRPKRTFAEWIRQKRRHFTTGKHYRWYHRMILGLFSLSQWAFFILFVLLLAIGFPWYLTLGGFALRLCSQWLIYGYAMKKLKTRKILLISPILEPLLLLMLTYIVLTNQFVRQPRWK